ncbi:MAG: hypothetical protein CMJ39_04515 [Phycisphaerae bacterium]|nr:hypothetical protein [Phycisphaerae bacterium]
MSLLRLYPLMSFAVVLLAIVAQCLSQRNPWLLVLAGGLAALSRAISEGPRGVALPRAISLTLTCIALLWSASVASVDLSQPIPAIGQFVVWLTVIKLYERHTLENEAERLILALLLMVLACLISIDLLFGLLLLFWSGFGLITLMLFQLHCAAERQQLLRAQALSIAEPGSPQPVSGPGLRRHYRNISLVSLVLVFGLSAAAFLLFPRQLTSGLSTVALNTSGRAEVALSQGVDLLGATRISLSGAQVLSVGLTNEQGETIRLDRPLRLRGSVLTAYRGDGIWEISSWGPSNMELQADRWRTFPGPEDAPMVTQDFILDEPQEQILSMSVPVGIKADSSLTMEFRASSQTMGVARDSTPPMKYEIRAIPGPPLYLTPMPNRGVPGAEMIQPYANSRVQLLAISLLERAGVSTLPPENREERLAWNTRVTEVFERHLKYGEYQYTLDLTDVGSTTETSSIDPIERFLLRQKFGHCEYFASALVGLCHTVQVPARLVVGYVTNRYDELSQRYVVVRSDAHAWVEVLGVGPRWQVFDPTPPANVPGTREASMGPLDKITWFWRWLEGQWRFNVLGFDYETQLYLTENLMPGLRERISEAMVATGRWLERVQRSLGIGWLLYLVLAVILAAAMILMNRFYRSRRRSHRVLERVGLHDVSGRVAKELSARLGFYVDMLDLLQEAGHVKPDWQPPAAFAETLQQHHPRVACEVAGITASYYFCRYGEQALTESRTHEVKESMARLVEALGVKR